MSSASTLVAVSHQSRVTQSHHAQERRAPGAMRKRLWCDRLPCGRIVAELSNGTLLLCVRRKNHAPHQCFHPQFSRSHGVRRDSSTATLDSSLAFETAVGIQNASLMPLLEVCVNE
jgi:hypothetical protein